MTSEEKRKGFLETYKVMYKSREGMEDMLSWMDAVGFLDAPASTRFHGSYPGGLADHSNTVYLRLLCLREMLSLGEKIRDDSLFVCGYLHDLCKLEFYQSAKKAMKNPETGKWEDVDTYVINEHFPMGHGEKSAYIAAYFLKLTAQEALAIRWHMGGYRDGELRSLIDVWKKARDTWNEALILMTHMADAIATYVDEGDAWPEGCSVENASLSGWHVFRDKLPAVPAGITNEEHFKLLFNHFLGKREGADKLLAYICSKQSDFFTAPAHEMNFCVVPGGLCEQTLRMFYAMVNICDMLQFQTLHTNVTVDSTAAGIKLKASLNIQTVSRIARIVADKTVAIEQFNQQKDEKGAVTVTFDTPCTPGKYVVWYTPDADTLMEAIAAASLLNGVGRINTYEVEMRNRKAEDGTWEKYPYIYKNEEIPWGSTGAKSVFMAQPFMRLLRDEALALRWYEGPTDGIPFYPCSAAFAKSPLAFCAHMAFLLSAYTNCPFVPAPSDSEKASV